MIDDEDKEHHRNSTFDFDLYNTTIEEEEQEEDKLPGQQDNNNDNDDDDDAVAKIESLLQQYS